MGNGGSISLATSTGGINVTGGALNLTANGVGTGNGGTIYVSTAADGQSNPTGNIVLGSATGNIGTLSATSGLTGGNGGSITIDSAASVSIPNTTNIINVSQHVQMVMEEL